MIITIDIADSTNKRLETEKRKTGMSKSLIVRNILKTHFEQRKTGSRKEVCRELA